jgi:hypothetical protein
MAMPALALETMVYTDGESRSFPKPLKPTRLRQGFGAARNKQSFFSGNRLNSLKQA